MSTSEILLTQTVEAHQWTNKLIDAVPFGKWDETPPTIESNISWQVGHLITSKHYHAIMCVHGVQGELMEKIPFRDYAKLFAFGSPASDCVGRVNPENLKSHLVLVQEWSEKLIKNLTEEEMDEPLHATKMPNPVAKTKFQAISWNIKHIMWHCGQIAILRRLVSHPVDFGIKKPE